MAEVTGVAMAISWDPQASIEIAAGSESFAVSATLFRVGLALVTFEQVRPFGIMLSDWCFFLSLLFLFSLPKYSWTKATGLFPAGALIFAGALSSLLNDSDRRGAAVPLAKLFILFGLFAPLAVVHAMEIRNNLSFLFAGISVNCAVTVVQAWALPGIVDVLSINPQTPDQSEFLRSQGLTEFPVTLGLAAALGVVIGTGIVLSERRRLIRWCIIFAILVCIEGALLSGSRTFFAALIPSLFVLAMLQNSRRRVTMQALTVAIVLAGLTYFFPGAVSQFSDRIGEVGFFDYGRLAVAGQALIEISQKPILGWGITHFDEAGLTWFPGMYGDEPQRAHVTLLLYWYGAGILGATGFLALFVIPARNMIRVLRGPPCKHTNAVRLMLACYVCFFIVFNLGPYLHNRYLYIPLFVFAGYAARARGSVEAPSALRRHALSSRPLENPQPST